MSLLPAKHDRFHDPLLTDCLSGHAGVKIVKSATGTAIKNTTNGSYASANALIIFSSIYVWPLALFATFMLVVHTWMAVTNSTTFEITKGGEGGIDYLQGTKECDLPFSNVSSAWSVDFLVGVNCQMISGVQVSPSSPSSPSSPAPSATLSFRLPGSASCISGLCRIGTANCSLPTGGVELFAKLSQYPR